MLLLTYWPIYKRYQDEKDLDSFWKIVFEAWFNKWPISSTPSPALVRAHKTPEAARMMMQKEKGVVRGGFIH